MEMKALCLMYLNPVLIQIQGCAIFLRYWMKLLRFSHCVEGELTVAQQSFTKVSKTLVNKITLATKYGTQFMVPQFLLFGPL